MRIVVVGGGIVALASAYRRCVHCSPPTGHPPHHHYEMPCTPLTFTSRRQSTAPPLTERNSAV
jgi:hypothetical protein